MERRLIRGRQPLMTPGAIEAFVEARWADGEIPPHTMPTSTAGMQLNIAVTKGDDGVCELRQMGR
jgi:hypothetical protein